MTQTGQRRRSRHRVATLGAAIIIVGAPFVPAASAAAPLTISITDTLDLTDSIRRPTL